jgi:AraC-like DNA-binding protein/quercetin dioxygenase-like cupin family protein
MPASPAPRSTDPLDYQAVPARVAAMAKDFVAGHVIAPHSHARAQLIHSVTGMARVTTEDGAWVVPPGRALWVPAGTVHGLRMAGAVAMRTLYIVPEAAPFMPAACRVVSVTPLLRELILAATEAPVDDVPTGRSALMAALILEELQRAEALPLHVPLPRDPRLARLCRALIDDPACPDSLETWADRTGLSPRTLARLFQRETGYGFAAWRQQARLAEALARLSVGESVDTVARALGYAGPSAFTAMFRRALGAAPRDYLA